MKNKTEKKKIVLLDSHAILHRAYHAMPHFATRDGRPTGALYGFVSMVLRMEELFQPEHIVACFDLPKPTFRHVAYEGYKDGRAKTDDVLVVQIKEAIRVAGQLSLPVYSCEGYEADDMLGTICRQMEENDEYEIIIASGDMDTFQLIKDGKVSVFTLRKGGEGKLFHEQDVFEKYALTPEQIKDFKGLAGDTSDNITGVPGIGEKTATSLLHAFTSVEGIYKALKESRVSVREKGFSERIVNLLVDHEEEALFSKTLATIHKESPITFVIPEKPWRDSLNEASFDALCDEFEFRQLKGKLKVIHSASSVSDEGKEEEKKEEVSFNEEELEDLKIMANLLSSEDTNPNIETIERIAGVSRSSHMRDVLEAKLKDEGLLELYDSVEAKIQPILKEMKKEGIMLDVAFLQALSKELHETLSGVEKKIHELAGEVFTINSPKQLSAILYDKLLLGEKVKKTKTGNKTTNAEQLEKMKDEHPIIPLILEYRELHKLLSTYIDSLPQYVKEDGRIHAHFVQTGAGTGRFSCEDPNLQNLPVKSELGKKVREAFIAKEGYVLLSCDYAQIDLRSAAILSQDKELISIFEEGTDVHTGTAMRMFHVDADGVTDQMRRKAKAINFGILYGMGVTSLKEGMGVERKEAQEYFDTYKETFVRLISYLEEVKAFAFSHGYTETILKRRRQVPLLKSHIPFMRAQGERIAINAPIQGTSADILKLGMIDTAEYVKDFREKHGDSLSLLLQIHDELVFEVKEEYGERVRDDIARILENVLKKRKIATLPLKVSSSIGKNLKSL